MKREVYESQKAFAGEKKPSMLRRCVDHDYTDRMMYMVTMVTEGRRPLFGKVVGRSNASLDSPDAPRMELNELGRRVEACWYEIAVRQPKIKLIALQMMPDHFHGILFVTERLERSLGSVLLGFKQGCNKAFREVLSVAVVRQQTEPNDRTHGLLFTPGFNDKLLLRQGQLAERPYGSRSTVLSHWQPLPPRPSLAVASAMLPTIDRGANPRKEGAASGISPQRRRPRVSFHFPWGESHHACRFQRWSSPHHPSREWLHRSR